MRSWPDSLVVKQTTHDRSCLSLLKLQTKLYGFRIFASHVNTKEKQTKTLNSHCLRLCKIVYFVSFNCKPINKIGNEEIIIEWEQSNEQGRLVKIEQVNPTEWQYGAKFRNLLYIYIHDLYFRSWTQGLHVQERPICACFNSLTFRNNPFNNFISTQPF